MVLTSEILEICFLRIPRMLQFPNQRECKQNCAKRDSRGAPLIARAVLCSAAATSGNRAPADITMILSNHGNILSRVYFN